VISQINKKIPSFPSNIVPIKFSGIYEDILILDEILIFYGINFDNFLAGLSPYFKNDKKNFILS
jgi:hypothetical protein